MGPFLFLVLILFLLSRFHSYMDKKYANKVEDVKPVTELSEAEREQRLQDLKVCPPHKWRHHEVFDEHGNLVKWKLICDLCGPLGTQEPIKREL